MNFWHWLSRGLPVGFRRGARAEQLLSEAYQRVFVGNSSATEADKEMVLTDLANWTGFYRANGFGVSADDRAFADGQRAAFARIFRFLRMTAEERRFLEEAARQEALVDSEEGQI